MFPGPNGAERTPHELSHEPPFVVGNSASSNAAGHRCGKQPRRGAEPVNKRKKRGLALETYLRCADSKHPAAYRASWLRRKQTRSACSPREAQRAAAREEQVDAGNSSLASAESHSRTSRSFSTTGVLALQGHAMCALVREKGTQNLAPRTALANLRIDIPKKTIAGANANCCPATLQRTCCGPTW